MQFDSSRNEILRFVLFWLLCVDNRERESASKSAFKLLREREYELFPGQELYEKLCKDNLSVRIQHPDAIEDDVISSGSIIRAWGTRFYEKSADGTWSVKHPTYVRWFHAKHLLLWVQRRTLVTEFKDADPLAGRDDETPYDYDHICPQNDWNTDFRSNTYAFKRFCENQQASVVGDSIGNLRIEDSSSNRYNQDAPASWKLGLNEIDSEETQRLLEQSAISPEEAQGFKVCSVTEGSPQGHWDEARALAFQEVVEKRAFRLFRQYFKEGGFDQWFPTPIMVGSSNPELSADEKNQ